MFKILKKLIDFIFGVLAYPINIDGARVSILGVLVIGCLLVIIAWVFGRFAGGGK